MRRCLLAMAVVVLASSAPAAGQQLETYTLLAENMAPRLETNHRVEFDLAAYLQAPPAVGDIVLIRPPRGALSSRCARPRAPTPAQLCVRPHGGPAPDPLRFITRVVAVAGDKVRFRRGRVIRNGIVETRRGLYLCPEGLDGCTFPRAITVPAGHVYVAGDNRAASSDSRFWGAVPHAQVMGRYVRTVGTVGTR